MITFVSSITSAIRPRRQTTLLSLFSSPSRVGGLRSNQCCKSNLGSGWKRVLLADGPRQSINALTLYAFYLTKQNDGNWYDVGKYFKGNTSIIISALTVSTLFTVIIFAGSLILLIIAGVCYVPLLCHIQGNLKEYCCHKVDKVPILYSPPPSRHIDLLASSVSQRLSFAGTDNGW